MSVWIDPGVVINLRRACNRFLHGEISVLEMQAAVFSAEQSVRAHDEKWFREALTILESRIEEAVFTVSEADLDGEVACLIKKILAQMDHHESK